MEEYTTFCDDELSAKGYAIKTAESSIADLTADIEDAAAQMAEEEDEITMLGSEIAAKDKELTNATMVRTSAHDVFVASEKELLTSIDELMGAIAQLKQGMAFTQGGAKALDRRLEPTIQAIGRIVEAESLDAGSRRKLKSFLQASQADEEDDDLSMLSAPKAAAIESKAGGILGTIEDMQEKAEDTLSELRQKEMKEQQSFELISSGLEDELKHGKDKLSDATQNKAAASEAKGKAEAELAEVKKTKAADEEYSATLNTDCQAKASEWEERQKSAKEEMGAIEKAKEILVGGVKVFVQVSTKTAAKAHSKDADDDDDQSAAAR